MDDKRMTHDELNLSPQPEQDGDIRDKQEIPLPSPSILNDPRFITQTGEMLRVTEIDWDMPTEAIAIPSAVPNFMRDLETNPIPLSDLPPVSKRSTTVHAAVPSEIDGKPLPQRVQEIVRETQEIRGLVSEAETRRMIDAHRRTQEIVLRQVEEDRITQKIEAERQYQKQKEQVRQIPIRVLQITVFSVSTITVVIALSIIAYIGWGNSQSLVECVMGSEEACIVQTLEVDPQAVERSLERSMGFDETGARLESKVVEDTSFFLPGALASRMPFLDRYAFTTAEQRDGACGDREVMEAEWFVCQQYWAGGGVNTTCANTKVEIVEPKELQTVFDYNNTNTWIAPALHEYSGGMEGVWDRLVGNSNLIPFCLSSDPIIFQTTQPDGSQRRYALNRDATFVRVE
ncbi:MAG: hypothetical protein ACOYLB_09325 [Phototrophicaceae bacterium]